MNKNATYHIWQLAIVVFLLLIGQELRAQLPDYNPNGAINYIRTWDATGPTQSEINLINGGLTLAKEGTQYFDGLGRPIQTVIRQGSLITDPLNPTSSSSATDFVKPVVYDLLGRESYKYLAYPVPAANNGAFKYNPFQQQASFFDNVNTNNPLKGQGETFFYSKTNFDASPLNRVSDVYAPGASWVGSESNIDPLQRRNMQTKFATNTLTDAVRIWIVTNDAILGELGTYNTADTYQAGELYKTITTDEHKKQVVEFKDKEGKVILKKVQLAPTATDNGTGSGHQDWLCTYYIYDNLGQLRCVIQPEGVKAILSTWSLTNFLQNEQCFRYEYDAHNRMITKKIPGSGEVRMVYDERDRLVLTQDAKMKNGTPQKWMYTQYDEFNRPVATGLLPSSLTWAQHASNAANSITYPTLIGEEELTRTFYDDYTWLSANGNPFANTRSILNDGYFNAAITTYPYYQALTQSNALKGMVTGSMIKVLGTATYLYSISFYDDKGRVIQVQAQNITTGTDINTTQYNWAGQPMMSVLRQQKAGTTNPQTNIVISQLTYDHLGRVTKTEKKVSNSLVNSGALPTLFTTTSELQYDALGQLKKKALGKKPGTSTTPITPLAKLDYEYNIRGWLLSVNKNYVTNSSNSNEYFGMQLGYDKPGTLGTFIPQYNGNIGGTIWKSEGDQEKRKYDFSYDAVNRLTKANFTQYVSGSGSNAIFDVSAGIDFSVGGDLNTGDVTTQGKIKYDANGNIKEMWQTGLKLNSPAVIDKLNYSYLNSSGIEYSNKLLKVTDGITTTDNGKLGDFKDGANATSDDYSYDVNGNLVTDNNKDISSITYNHLNLPSVITVTGKGSITYTYDATGTKLKKQTLETPTAANGNKTITTTTTYLDGMVYESKTTSPTDPNYPDYTDKLQLIGHEEGRIRALYTNTQSPNTPTGLAYDYMLKDHLGNVRVVLTEEVNSNIYPPATLEGNIAPNSLSMVNWEKSFYTINSDNNITAVNSIPGWSSPAMDYANNNGDLTPDIRYPSNYTVNGTATSQQMYKTNAASNKTDLSFVIKVMAGDKIDIFGKSYYYAPNQTFDNSNSASLILTNIISAFLGSPGNPAPGKGVTTGLMEGWNNGPNGIPPGFIRGGNGESSSIPKAYINYILFDEHFKYAGGGASRVGSSGAVKTHYNDPAMQGIVVPKNGYIYVYVSNESNTNVFFDNIQVMQTSGPILEETHYYPFGLTMSGISSKAAGGIQNKLKYNGKEIQSAEFSDGSGLEEYDYGWRHYDQQIGRFMGIDPMAVDFASWTPYNYTFNNPVNFIDPNGATGEPVIDEKNKTVTIKSTLWFYGGAANQARATEIASAIQNQWNDAAGTMMVKGANGEVEYKVVFEITGEYASDKVINDLRDDGKAGNYVTSAKDNFVRLEETGQSSWQDNNGSGGNSGFINYNEFKKNASTVAHEYGHGLGWKEQSQKDRSHHDFVGNVINGFRVPSIMTAKYTKFSDMLNLQTNTIGPLAYPNSSYFNRANNEIDPDKRKVYQRDINIILRNFDVNSTKSIGGKSPALYDATGKNYRIKL